MVAASSFSRVDPSPYKYDVFMAASSSSSFSRVDPSRYKYDVFMAASSSSFSRVYPGPYKYDVFMSVRGDVTRHNFTSLLYSALLENQIEVFVESEVEGFVDNVELKTDIERAVEKSAISIIVFSEDYISSAWCLDQLMHILKCKKEKGQIVLPIFHGVDRSDIRTLREATGLSNWDSRGKSGPELVEAVVQDVVRRLTEIWSTSIDNSNGLMCGAFLSAFVEDLFRRLRSPDFLDYLKGKEPIQKKFTAVKTKLLSAYRVLNDAEDQQLTNAAVKEWLDHLKVLLFRADQLMDNINYEVLRRKLEGASESSTSNAKFCPKLGGVLPPRGRLLRKRILLGQSELRPDRGNITTGIPPNLLQLSELRPKSDNITTGIPPDLLPQSELRQKRGNITTGISPYLLPLSESWPKSVNITTGIPPDLSRQSELWRKRGKIATGIPPDFLPRCMLQQKRGSITTGIPPDLLRQSELRPKRGTIRTSISPDLLRPKRGNITTSIRPDLLQMSELRPKTDNITTGIPPDLLPQSELRPKRGNIKNLIPPQKQSSTSFATFDYSMEEEITGIFDRLELLIAQKDKLGLKELTENIVSQRSRGTPLALKPEVYDREDVKEAIMKSLLSDETYGDKTPLVFPIVGTGVSSKTTPGEDLNAHPDFPIIGQETGGIGKTNLGEYFNALPNLQRIREEIVKKCKGHPIAVKYAVALLRSIASRDELRMILKSHIWDLKLQENASKHVLPALWLSYRYLSPLLKRCLVYCAIFPKGYEFDKKKLILLWMAEGLLQSKRRTRMEDVGQDFFKILTSRSFFEESVHDKSKFTMHDCVHDLATFVLGDFGFQVEDDNMHNIRHLSFMKEKIGDVRYFEGISEARYLRTFLPLESNKPFRHTVPLKELLTEKECLRVLSLSQYPCIAELPNSILESKSLRYLDFSSTSIRNIPDTICTLYNLETLLLSNCENLTRLPSEIRCLIKLRYLDFAGSPIKELPPQICKLKDLQTLTRFIVCKEHSRIEELGDLQQLHGEFEICGLENVVDVKKVSVAKLREKKFLTSLGLFWDGESCDGTLEEREILNLLQPHEDLKALHIYGFAGERFPDWMGDQSFGDIVEMQLSECKNCCMLPPLGQLPSLKNLQISGFKSVVTIGWEFCSYGSSTTKPFRSLEVLRFEDMAIWQEFLFTEDQVFPSLKELVFYKCPKLDVWLPDCFPSLTKLLVSHCRQLMPLLGFQSLEELEIFACPKQVIFLQEGWPSRLKKIKISRCESLKLLHCIQSKKEKELLHCKDFQHLTSLESLEIIECKELHRLPEELPTYPFELSIVECPFLESGGWENEEDWPN